MSIDALRFYQHRWALWKAAKEYVSLPGKCHYTLIFTLGRDDFGWEYGSQECKYQGAALDLTGATVVLKIVQLSYSPGALDLSRGRDWIASSTLATITGAIVDAISGIVSFDLDTDDTDAIGNYIGEIQVTDSNSKEITPGYVKMHFLEGLRS